MRKIVKDMVQREIRYQVWNQVHAQNQVWNPVRDRALDRALNPVQGQTGVLNQVMVQIWEDGHE